MDTLYLSELRAFLRYVDLPGRRPVVYLTGLGLAVSGTYHRCVVDPTLGEHRALLADFLGAGFSDAPEAFSYSLEDHAKTVATLLDRLALAQSTVIAYSFGGVVAVTLAATRPDLSPRWCSRSQTWIRAVGSSAGASPRRQRPISGTTDSRGSSPTRPRARETGAAPGPSRAACCRWRRPTACTGAPRGWPRARGRRCGSACSPYPSRAPSSAAKPAGRIRGRPSSWPPA